MTPVRVGRDHVNVLRDFVATFITDERLKERVVHVFSALPKDVQEEFMGDPAFAIGTYDTARSEGAQLVIPSPQSARGSRLVTLECSLSARARAFAHYVIAHEFAHALLWNRGRQPEEDPEIAADSLAARWGFPRPSTLPLF